MNWLHWSLLSALFAGVTAVLAKMGTKDVDPNLATAIRTVVVLIIAASVGACTNTHSLRDIPAVAWLFLALSGLATSASWLCYFNALKVGDVARVATVDKLGVVVAMVLAATVLGEATTIHHWLGAALIVGGAMLIAWH